MEACNFFLVSLLLLICIHSLLHILFNKRNLPPGPKGLPIIGNLLAIGHRPLESLTKLAKIHGPLMTIQLGFNTTIVVSSAEMAREILQKNNQAFLGRPIPHAVTAQTDYHLAMAWSSASQKWKNLRKLCATQIFTTHRLDALQGLRDQMMENVIKRVTEASESGEAISIGRLVFGIMLNLLSNTIFSVDIIDPKSNTIQELRDLVWRIMELAGKPNLADYFPILKPFDIQHIKRDIKGSYDRLHELLDELVDLRMKRRASRLDRCNDFLDVLLDYSKENGSEEFGRKDIRILLMDLFIGGTDTTATTMEWTMTELLHNPKAMATVKQELNETIGIGQCMEEKEFGQLPYLQAVLKESMRLHPPTPLLLPHRAEVDVEMCGYTIPKHTQVLVNYWAIAQDPMYWDKPKQFLPQRFMGSDVDFRGTNFSFIPFGAGRRICPGLPLAIRMLTLLSATLIRHFDWKLPNGMVPEEMDMQDKFGLTLQKAVPLVAVPVAVAIAN